MPFRHEHPRPEHWQLRAAKRPGPFVRLLVPTTAVFLTTAAIGLLLQDPALPPVVWVVVSAVALVCWVLTVMVSSDVVEVCEEGVRRRGWMLAVQSMRWRAVVRAEQVGRGPHSDGQVVLYDAMGRALFCGELHPSLLAEHLEVPIGDGR